MLFLINNTFQHAVVNFTIIIVSYVKKKHYYGKHFDNIYVGIT